jgi:uncharacterized protein YfcZ (UPF0381/DUF406 family)
MKRVRDKMVKETIRLDQCQERDRIRISHGMRGATEWFGGNFVLVKIKPMPNGLVQIKYRSQFGKNPTVQKMNLGGESIVERTRLWQRGDSEDKAFYPNVPVTVNEVTHDVNADTQEEAEAIMEREIKKVEATNVEILPPLANEKVVELSDTHYQLHRDQTFGLDAGMLMGQMFGDAISRTGGTLKRIK